MALFFFNLIIIRRIVNVVQYYCRMLREYSEE